MIFDHRLMAGVARGEARAKEALVASHYRAINRFLSRLTFGHDEAQDLTQQTFLKATTKADTFRGDRPLRSWLRGIAYHEFTHWLRDKDREVAPLAETAGSTLVLSDAVVLHEAIGQLTELPREAFLLHEVVGLSVREIAELLGCPTGTVKFRLHAARTALRTLLTPSEENHESQANRRSDPSRCPSA